MAVPDIARKRTGERGGLDPSVCLVAAYGLGQYWTSHSVCVAAYNLGQYRTSHSACVAAYGVRQYRTSHSECVAR
eukprot:530540-Rhodomonas_salina.1